MCVYVCACVCVCVRGTRAHKRSSLLDASELPNTGCSYVQLMISAYRYLLSCIYKGGDFMAMVSSYSPERLL